MGTRIYSNSGFYVSEVYIIHQLNKNSIDVYQNNREYFMSLRIAPYSIKTESLTILGMLDDNAREDADIDFMHGLKDVKMLIDPATYKPDL